MDTIKTTNISFQELLDKTYVWPAFYTFKFIVPSVDLKTLTTIFIGTDGLEIKTKTSKNNKFTSVSIKKMMKSSNEIMEAYEKASKIEGIISL